MQSCSRDSVDSGASKACDPVKKIQLAKIPTKRFTPAGASMLERVDTRKVCIFDVDQEPVYKKLVIIKQAINPTGFIISFHDDMECANSVEKRTHLLQTLLINWESTNKPFDMTRQFPAECMYVIVALQVDKYLDEDAALLSTKSKGRVDTIYQRGFIIKINAGPDIESAIYDIFLYDCGTLAHAKLQDIRQMTEQQRLLYSPVYRMFRIPGLFPMEERIVMNNLHEPSRKVLEICENWPEKTVAYVNTLLQCHAIQLEVLAEHGVFIYGDLKLANFVESETKTVDMSDFSTEKDRYEHYVANLCRSKYATMDEVVLQNILLLDCEDEKNINWLEYAYIPDF